MPCVELESIRPKMLKAVHRPLCRVLSGGKAIGLLLLLGLILLLGLEWFQPYYFTWDDNTMVFLPWRIFNYRTLLTSGELPWINFHQFLGHEHFLAGQTGVLFWPGYVATFLADHVLGNIGAVIEVEMILTLLAGLVAFYAFLRVIKVPVVWCVYGSLLSLTLPFWLCLTKNSIAVGHCFFFFPLCMACLEAYLRCGARRYLLPSSLVKALCFYEGNMNFICIYLLGEGVYFLLRFRSRSSAIGIWQGLGWYFFSNVLAVIIALPLVIPMWMAVPGTASRSTALPLWKALTFSIQPMQWLLTQFYQHSREIFFSVSSSALYYLGGFVLLPSVLIIAFKKSWLASTRTVAWGVVALTLVAFLLSTECNAVLRYLPVFDRMRWPFKWYVWCVFGYCVFFALVAHQLTARRILARHWVHGLFILAIGSNLFVALQPIAQITFSNHHIDSPLMSRNDAALGEGRCQPYRMGSPRALLLMESHSFDYATLLGSQAFAGYDPLIAAQVFDQVFGMNCDSVYQEVINPVTREHFNQWSVRYFITSNSPEAIAELQALGGMRFVRATGSGLALVENSQARPYATMESRPDKALPVRFGVNEVEIKTEGNAGEVVLTLINRPGWHYRFDKGDYQPVSDSTKLGQMRLQIPPHVDTVTVRYWPPLFREMVWLTLTLLSVLLVGWGVSIRYKMRSAVKSE